MKIEDFILINILQNEDYARKTLPYVKIEYFKNKPNAILYDIISSYVEEYNNIPTHEALHIELQNKTDINQETFNNAKELINTLHSEKQFTFEWAISKTEQFCQERAIHNALLKSIEISENKKDLRGSIPEILQEALSVSFDSHIGHNFIEDWETRYEYYTNDLQRKPFGIEMFNTITNGGVPNKTLTVAIAGTGVGKSRWMCYEAACDLERGLNVLYFTMEMSEFECAKRIDANLLDIDINDIRHIPKDEFKKKLDRLKTMGKLIIKEYPTATASATHFRHAINELKLKKNFIPDVVYIDYINICASSRIRRGSTTSYEYVKAIAEELRGLGDFPIITATQLNRQGFAQSDVGLENTAESFGLPATADFMFAIISTEELKELNQQLVKQLKNRFGDPSRNTRFVIGIDPLKMRYYDVDPSAQEDILDGPVMDNTNFGQENFNRNKFDGFF